MLILSNISDCDSYKSDEQEAMMPNIMINLMKLLCAQYNHSVMWLLWWADNSRLVESKPYTDGKTAISNDNVVSL